MNSEAHDVTRLQGTLGALVLILLGSSGCVSSWRTGPDSFHVMGEPGWGKSMDKEALERCPGGYRVVGDPTTTSSTGGTITYDRTESYTVRTGTQEITRTTTTPTSSHVNFGEKYLHMDIVCRRAAPPPPPKVVAPAPKTAPPPPPVAPAVTLIRLRAEDFIGTWVLPPHPVTKVGVRLRLRDDGTFMLARSGEPPFVGTGAWGVDADGHLVMRYTKPQDQTEVRPIVEMTGDTFTEVHSERQTFHRQH